MKNLNNSIACLIIISMIGCLRERSNNPDLIIQAKKLEGGTNQGAMPSDIELSTITKDFIVTAYWYSKPMVEDQQSTVNEVVFSFNGMEAKFKDENMIGRKITSGTSVKFVSGTLPHEIVAPAGASWIGNWRILKSVALDYSDVVINEDKQLKKTETKIKFIWARDYSESDM